MENSIKTDNSNVLNEKSRIYTFPSKNGNVKITINDVIELVVRASGSHRLRTKDGKLHYVSSGFLHIEIENDKKDWTY